MGLWDHIKPVSPAPQPVRIEQLPGRILLSWDDRVKTEIGFRALRLGCPCAGCVEEWSGRHTLDPAQVPEDIGVSELHAVGNYALAATFTDGHSTGIFSWKTLRSLGETLSS